MKNFCVMPWYSQEVDLVQDQETVCCWLQHKISRGDLQAQFINQDKPEVCKKCWNNEQQGIESRRQMENRFLDYKLDRDLVCLQNDAIQARSEISLYQIFVGSTCNGACVTCGPGLSSTWRRFENQIKSTRKENLQADTVFTKWSQTVNWGRAKRFNILGGEPLLIKRSFAILQQLIDANNTDCRISFVTNGNVILADRDIELIQKFSDISCCVSIDGLGKTFDYIRYPLSWDTLLENLNRFRDIFSTVEVSFTVSNLNYHERNKTLQWFRDQDLLYIENYVRHPEWFHYQVGPNHALWPKFVQEIRRQDTLKGIKIDDYIPHIAGIMT